MKLDPLLLTVVLLNVDSGTPLHCKIRQRSSPTHRLCVELDDSGSLRGRVVSCGRDEACDDPQYYPCDHEKIVFSTDSTSSYGGTTEERKSTAKFAPVKAPNIFRFNITDKVRANGTTNYIDNSSTTQNFSISEAPPDSTSTSIAPCDPSEKSPAPLCNQYVTCSPKTGKYLLQTCPEGTAFDQKSQQCTSRHVNCSEATAISTKSPNPLNHLINGANIIISAITAVLIIIGFILIDFIL